MTLRAKTVKRLTILGVLAGVTAVGAIGFKVYRMQKTGSQASELRADGMKAYKSGDYSQALNLLGQARQKKDAYAADVELLTALANARYKQIEPWDQQIQAALADYRSLVAVDPSNEVARKMLVEIFSKLRYNTEVVQELEGPLAHTVDPKDIPDCDPKMLRAKAVALVGLRQFDKALVAAKAWNEKDPGDIDGQVMTLAILIQQQQPMGDILNRAYALHAAAPADARFDLMLSIACSLTKLSTDELEAGKSPADATSKGNHDAVYWVLQAGARPIDERNVPLLVGQLDAQRKFGMLDASKPLSQLDAQEPSAVRVLYNAITAGTKDEDIRRMWVLRLWALKRFNDLADFDPKLDPADAKSDPDILGLRAMALVTAGRAPETKPIIAGLISHGDNCRRAGAWGHLLEILTSKTPDLGKTTDALRHAQSFMPTHPVVALLLGDALSGVNDFSGAQAEWDLARSGALYWSLPYLRLSTLMAKFNNPRAAFEAASEALERFPDDHDSMVTRAKSWAMMMVITRDVDRANLEKFVNKIDALYPHDPDMLPVYLLIQLTQTPPNTAGAIVRFKSELETDTKFTEPSLLHLAEFSRDKDLGMEQVCLDKCEKLFGLTPNLVYLRAKFMATQKADDQKIRDQNIQQARKYFEDIYKQHSAVLGWTQAWAQFLDDTQDTAAKGVWIAMAEANPKSLPVQWSALEAKCVQDDHAFLGATIKRLQAQDMVGMRDTTLRYRKVCWTLQGQPSAQDISDARLELDDIVRLAPNFFDARVRLAQLLEMQHNPLAAEQWAAAAALQTDNAALSLHAASLLLDRGDSVRARELVDRALAVKQIPLEDKKRAAALLGQLGDYQRASQTLQDAEPDQKVPSLLLASLYREQGLLDESENVCKTLLEKPEPGGDPEKLIAFYADLLAFRGHMDDANNVLKGLDGLKLEPGRKEMVLGDFYSRHAPAGEARAKCIELFSKAAQLAPANPLPWQLLIGTYLTPETANGEETLTPAQVKERVATDGAKAMTALRAACAAVPAGTVFDPLKDADGKNLSLVDHLMSEPNAWPLVQALFRSSRADQDAILETLHTLDNAKSTNEPILDTLAKLRKQADRNLRIEALQAFLVRLNMLAGQTREAVFLATRAMETYPTSADAARLATSAMMVAQRWDDAVTAAKRWRERTLSFPLPADIAISSAYLAGGHPGDAWKALNADKDHLYTTLARRDPDRMADILVLSAKILLADGRYDLAQELFIPKVNTFPAVLPRSAQWRMIYMRLAVNSISSPPVVAQWLEKVEPLLSKDPQTSQDETLTLASGWHDLGLRTDNATYKKHGRDLLEALAARPDCTPTTLGALGVMRDADGDAKGAEEAYRQTIARGTNTQAWLLAVNNLAMLLSNHGANLDEALKLADQAVEATHSQAAGLLDTRASVLAAMHRYDDAVKSEKAAVALEPTSFEWQLNLAHFYLKANRKDLAKDTLSAASAIMPLESQIPMALKGKYDDLKAALQ